MEPCFYDAYQKLEETHWWFRGRRAVLTAVLSRVAPAATTSVFDFGCGPGGLILTLRALGYRAQGGDIHPTSVAAARARGLKDTLLLSENRVPLPDASCDMVTLLDVLEHVRDEASLLAEARRLVRPGGHLLITVPAFPLLWGIQDEVSHHYRRYRKRGLAAALRAAGLEIVFITYFNTALFFPVAFFRLAHRVAKIPRQSDFFPLPHFINRILGALFAAEAPLVGRVPLPWGISVIALVRNPLSHGPS